MSPLISSLSQSFVVGTTFPKIVTNGLVLYVDAGLQNSYSGSGTIWRDLSGRDNNGTLASAPSFPIYTSFSPNYFSFDGNDYVSLGTPSILNQVQVPLTITCWAKLNSTIGLSTLYSAYKNINPAGAIYSLFRVDNGTLKYYSSAFSSDTGGFNYQFRGNFLVSANIWYFYTVSVSGSLLSPNVKIFLNDSSESFSYTKLYTPVDASVDFRIGGNQSVLTEGWKGDMALVKVYNRALTDEEVAQNFNALRGRFGI